MFPIKKLLTLIFSLFLLGCSACAVSKGASPQTVTYETAYTANNPPTFYTENLFTKYVEDMYGSSSMLIEPAAYIPLSGWLPEEAFASGEIEGKNSYIFKLQDDCILKIRYDEEAFSDFTGDILISHVPVAYRFEDQILTDILLYYNGFSVEFSIGSDRSSPVSPFLTSAERLADPRAAEQEVSRLKNVIDFHLETYPE